MHSDHNYLSLGTRTIPPQSLHFFSHVYSEFFEEYGEIISKNYLGTNKNQKRNKFLSAVTLSVKNFNHSKGINNKGLPVDINTKIITNKRV